MKKLILIITLFSIISASFLGCSSDASETDSETEAIWDTISAEEAKKMMEASNDLIILDVRTEEEYNESHIEGSILIPDTEVESKAEEMLPDKSATILVYCRSGRRSALASEILNKLGYTAIYDFGGITDWPYEVVEGN
ncbi:MAG: rhodanese-like domain-containing protein [Mobilitalea sp.]